MAITIQQFRTRYPQYADAVAFPDTLLDDVIQEADRCINDSFFGTRANDARLYLAAHLLISTTGDRADGVQSVSAGPASVTYEEALDDLDRTGQGRQYKRLIKIIGGARAVI